MTFGALLATLILAGCGYCQVGSACSGLTQEQVDKSINQKATSESQKKADCMVLSYHQTLDYGSGCVIEWK